MTSPQRKPDATSEQAFRYPNLGAFSDLADSYFKGVPIARPGAESQLRARQCLKFPLRVSYPNDVRLERSWTRDGIDGKEISYSVNFGPRTKAWILRPEGVTSQLPGVLALHDHGNLKLFGKEKIADGPEDPIPLIASFRQNPYSGRAFANDLAKRGFAVMIHDCFMWGSRKFEVDTQPQYIQEAAEILKNHPRFRSKFPGDQISAKDLAYLPASNLQEDIIERYMTLFNTSIAGAVHYDDRVALKILRSLENVDRDNIGVIGLSGGGNRAGLLRATCNTVKAAAVVAMMSTYEGLLTEHVWKHSWMLYPPGWTRFGDWPDLVACRAPAKLLCLYNNNDWLFSLDGQTAAHNRLLQHYHISSNTAGYTGHFFDGGHKFDQEMQNIAFDWLEQTLK